MGWNGKPRWERDDGKMGKSREVRRVADMMRAFKLLACSEQVVVGHSLQKMYSVIESESKS